ncbi:ATP-binding protein [Vitreoscilla massiliensis]|uniref:ATP-binding protein n=1 Tax=Vitreoscilla massiliensis TaxID=1689272 RepID=A0ABY4E0Y0_9NEIS|nr:AAA family ATPase [Vitreoscilla massiliensis]UOO89192.1 ATP-binding protein [Vitreoscilla massiliensis]
MNLDINIQNFGKVTDASIKLRQFTVISGPNSSGKSFITKALYSIFHEINDEITLKFLNELLNKIQSGIDEVEASIPNISAGEIGILGEANKTVYEIYNEIIHNVESVPLSQEEQLISQITPYVLKLVSYGNELLDVITPKPRKYKASINSIDSLRKDLDTLEKFTEDRRKFFVTELARKIKYALIENFQVTSLDKLINYETNSEESIFILNSENSFKILKSGSISYSFENKDIEELQRINKIIYLESPIYWKLKLPLTKIRLDRLRFNRFARRSLVETLLIGVPEYFYDLNDLLQQQFVEDNNDNYFEFVNKIQETVGGKISISTKGEMLFQQNGSKTKIELNATASGIVNLGLIGLLIEKGILSPDSMIFIDEPEVNLHPNWQHLMMEILFDLSKFGVQVVIATHSIDMIYKLETIVHNNENLLNSEHFGINHINENGITEGDLDILESIQRIKNDLGGAYADLFKQNSKISGF